MDTTTTYGKFFFNINCFYAQLQRDSIVQNTIAGLTSACARGRISGRYPVKNDKMEIALKM